MENEITKLTRIWYNIVGPQHHKDRDCHWYVYEAWSYGKPPVYWVEHYGYIYNNVENQKFAKRDEALEYLLDILKDAINDQTQWAKQVLKEETKWGADQIETAKTIVKLTADL